MTFFLFILRFSYQFWSIVLENWLINGDADIKLIYLIWCWNNLVCMLSVKLANNIPNKRYAIFEHDCVCVCVLYNYILYHRMVWRIVVKLHSRSLPAESCFLIMFISLFWSSCMQSVLFSWVSSIGSISSSITIHTETNVTWSNIRVYPMGTNSYELCSRTKIFCSQPILIYIINYRWWFFSIYST